MVKYQQVEDGIWYHQPKKDKTACCDCGLVHDVEWRMKNGKLEMRFFRNNRATAQVRRHMVKKGEL